jgi:hypothetical protein
MRRSRLLKPTDDKLKSEEMKQLLDKFDNANSKKSAKEISRIIYTITLSIISLIATVFFCYMIYKNNFSIESVISVLLAFFSILISILFYFKAADTSSKFYDSSYNFMKDQSNVLGRIEERFGEKFESLISRFDHLETKKISTEEQIDNKQEEISKTLGEAIEQLSQENANEKDELQRYKKQLDQKNEEYQALRNELSLIQNESNKLRHYMYSDNFNDSIKEFISILSPRDIDYILRTDKLQKSNKAYQYALKYNLCNEDGIINKNLKNYIERISHDNFYNMYNTNQRHQKDD